MEPMLNLKILYQQFLYYNYIFYAKTNYIFYSINKLFLNNNIYIVKNLIEFNFLFLTITLTISTIYIYIYISRVDNIKTTYKNTFNYIKYAINTLFIVSFLLHILTFYVYFHNSYNYYLFNLNNNLYSLNSINTRNSINILNILNHKLSFCIDLFGLALLMLSYIVGFISILVLDTRFNLKNIKYISYFNIFILIVFCFTTVNNIILFFICYELLMIPSFLIIYYLSNSRRSIQASLYFIIWTQIGSFLVLIVISYLIYVSNCYYFSDLIIFKFSKFEVNIIILILFLGFGFKVPIWPFHYWLTKTHVEAPSGFSIYLSGFLVKSALYGFYKLLSNINIDINTNIFVTICIIGVIDSSLKMWGQTDLKKLVAYGTIQEMNLIYLTLCIGDSTLVYVSIIFVITHAFLSSLMFYIVDCIYRRFNSRSIVEVNGVLHILPNLSICIILMIIFFSGIPGTLKFISEFILFNKIINILPITILILLILTNVLGLIGFSKIWFNALFGCYKKNIKNIKMDLSIKEGLIIFINFYFLIVFSTLFFIIY